MKLFLFSLLCISLYISSASAITQVEFNLSVTSCGYPEPSVEVYNAFCEGTRGWSLGEQAMVLGHMIYESRGFTVYEDMGCRSGGCASQYIDNFSLSGQSYHGRGCIQITYAANYRACGQAIGLGDQLLYNPGLVASSPRVAVLAGCWHWSTYVRPVLRGQSSCFGCSTRCMRPNECFRPQFRSFAVTRWNCYQRVCSSMRISCGSERGCYN